MIKSFYVFVVIFMFTSSVFAQEAQGDENFRCEIFKTTMGDFADGFLTLSDGPSDLELKYTLSLTDSPDIKPSEFDGILYVNDMAAFSDLSIDTQKSITESLKQSKRADLIVGPLLVLSNTKDRSESTLNVYLMPSGEIAYIEAGFLPVLCM